MNDYDIVSDCGEFYNKNQDLSNFRFSKLSFFFKMLRFSKSKIENFENKKTISKIFFTKNQKKVYYNNNSLMTPHCVVRTPERRGQTCIDVGSSLKIYTISPPVNYMTVL